VVKWWRRLVLLSCTVGGAIYVFDGRQQFWIFIVSIAVGLSLYVMREVDRVLYGLLEVLFAGFALWDAAGKGRGDFSNDFSNDFQTYQWLVILLQTGGAIYVLIRGLDNCKAYQLASNYKRNRELR
jgi:hypothetical protein